MDYGRRHAPQLFRIQNLPIAVEGHIAVHHGAYAYSRKVFYLHVVELAHIGAQISIAEMAGIEMVHIDENTTMESFKRELRVNDVYYLLNK